ncbi:MAG TPA: helix-turn-helix domain-containing protein, partial [Spirochaetales bacterium]|nr:helix-turn-helix domain-containing protein [Spirochaetales bacterium]
FICAEGDVIEADSIAPEDHGRHGATKGLHELVGEFEREVILRRLAFFKGNRTATAQDLGISLRNLQYKLEKYDLR